MAHSFSSLRNLALKLVTFMANCWARSMITFRFLLDTLWAISAAKRRLDIRRTSSSCMKEQQLIPAFSSTKDEQHLQPYNQLCTSQKWSHHCRIMSSTYVLNLTIYQILNLTLSHPESLHWWVKSSGVRQSKITKGMVLAGLGEDNVKIIKM